MTAKNRLFWLTVILTLTVQLGKCCLTLMDKDKDIYRLVY